MKINKSVFKKGSVATKVTDIKAIGQAVEDSTMATALAATKTALVAAGTSLGEIADDIKDKEDELAALYATQRQRERAADVSFDSFVDAAQTATGGDEAKIRSLHLVPYEQGTAPDISEITRVLKLAATSGDFEGTIDAMWEKVRGARQYLIQVTTTPTDPASWKLVAASVKTSFLIEGLVSGTKYYIRVAAVGSAGQGPWSAEENCLAG